MGSESEKNVNDSIGFSLFNGGSRPGHKVSGTRSKFPNLNENGQNLIFREVFQTQNPVKALSRSATATDDIMRWLAGIRHSKLTIS